MDLASRSGHHSQSRHIPFLIAPEPKTREQEVVFFNVLRSEQPFFGPKVAIRGVFVTLHQHQSGGMNSLCLNEFASGRDRLIFATFDAILWHILKNPSPFLPPTALALASPCQPPYLPCQDKCSDGYKSRAKYIAFAPKFQLVLIDRHGFNYNCLFCRFLSSFILSAGPSRNLEAAWILHNCRPRFLRSLAAF
jgi:hypothetical protein